MSDEKDKQVLDDYLKSGSPLSRRYHAGVQEEPPAHLDAAILAAATKAVTSKPSGGHQWYVPLSLAAIVVISFGLVFRVYQSVPQPEPELAAPAAEEFLLKDGPSEDAAIESAKSRSVETQVQQSREYSADDSAARLKKERMEESELRRDAPSAEADYSAMPAESAAGAAALSAPEPAPQPMTAPVTGELDELATTAERKQLPPQQWFEIINQLWFDGDEEGAINATKRFLEAYPDYPRDELKKMLPQDMDLSKLSE